MKAAFLLLLCYLATGCAWRCDEGPRLYNAVQIDAGQGKVIVRDTNGFVYFLLGRSWYRMTTLRFKHSSIGPAGLWATSTANRVYKFVSGNFLLANGLSLQQVDAGGDGQLVGVSTSSQAYCLRNTIASPFSGAGTLSWTALSRVMKYISCSPDKGCWGIDTSDRIYFTQRMIPNTCQVSGWVLVSGAAIMVEVGTDGNVFVVNKSGQVYQRVGISSRYPQGTSWSLISMCTTIRHVSYDLRTLWVISNSGLILKCTH
uniref:fish-egg lectin-like n=1 Tax=Scatophagus argus TaxID=75038 RepID=UPI001ED82B5B|nr:fish-egg lectin-like [Scatophagus argus]